MHTSESIWWRWGSTDLPHIRDAMRSRKAPNRTKANNEMKEERKKRHGDEFIGTKRCRKIVFFFFSFCVFLIVSCIRFAIFLFSYKVDCSRKSTMEGATTIMEKKKKNSRWNCEIRRRRAHCAASMQKNLNRIGNFFLLLLLRVLFLFCYFSVSGCADGSSWYALAYDHDAMMMMAII